MAGKMPITLKGKLVWIGLFLFVGGWMFLLGIIVGRGMVPVPMRPPPLDQELEKMRTAMLQNQRSGADSAGKGENDISETDLNFYESLKQSDGRVQPIAPKPSAPDVQPKAMHKPDPVKTQQQNTEETLPSTEKDTKPSPSDHPEKKAPNTIQRYTIQVAAVKDLANAEKMVVDLRKMGFEAYQIRNQASDGDVWHRVRVGAFEQRSEAEAVLTRLMGKKIKGLIINTQ